MKRFSISERLCYSRTQMVKQRTFYLALFLFFALAGAALLTGTARAQDGATETPDPTATPETTPTTDSQSSPTPTPEATLPEATSLPVVVPLIGSDVPETGYGPDSFPPFVNPLTGLAVADPALLDRRPMAIKVTNYPRYVRPQSGLEQADIVYEYYLERGIPRFIAVFYGQEAERVGPVRSGRLFDEHIFRMYDSLFVFGNADTRVMDYFLALEPAIRHSLIVENPNDRELTCGDKIPSRLCRDKELKTYNNLFANTAELTAYFDQAYGNYRPDLTGMHFSDQVPLSETPGIDIRVRYSLMIYHIWRYDENHSQYFRWQETDGFPDPLEEEYAPHYDYVTGQQLSAENVVVLFVDHEYYVKTERSEIYQIDLNGSGPAIVFRDGFAYQAQWVRPKDGGVLQLYTPDGKPFPLKPGQTWFQVTTADAEIDHNGKDWRFVFVPPPEPVEGIIKPSGEIPLEWFYRRQNPYGTWFFEDYDN